MSITRIWRRGWVGFLASRAGAWTIRYVVQPLDRLIIPRSRGRWSTGKLLGLYPTLLLHTVGAKSGQSRETPLIFMPDDPRIILIASNYGGTRHPAWYFNLRANPVARVVLNGTERSYLAREATGAEREELWRRAVAFYPGYGVYQQRTAGRTIPVMVLEPERREC